MIILLVIRGETRDPVVQGQVRSASYAGASRLEPAAMLPASRALRAGFAGGLRPLLTPPARGGREEDGRDGETALDRTEKRYYDGNRGHRRRLVTP